MSGISHAISKVVKGVVGFVKDHWKLLTIAAAVFFTGGMALGAFGAVGADAAAGGVAAAADVGVDAGVAGAAGVGVSAGADLGAGVAADFAGGAAADAGLGTGVAADFGATAAGTDSAVAGIGTAASSDTAGGLMDVAGSGSGNGIADAAGEGVNAGSEGVTITPDTPTIAQNTLQVSKVGITPASTNISMDGAAPSSMWSGALDTAGKIMSIPGVPQAMGGLLQGYEQGQMLNTQLAWQEAHAPGQIAGGVPQGMFSGMGANPNLKQSPIKTSTPKPVAAPGGAQAGAMTQAPAAYMPQQQQNDPYASYASQGLMGSPFMDGPSPDEV